MQDSTLIVLNRQLFATEVIFRREIASLYQGGGSVSSLFVYRVSGSQFSSCGIVESCESEIGDQSNMSASCFAHRLTGMKTNIAM